SNNWSSTTGCNWRCSIRSHPRFNSIVEAALSRTSARRAIYPWSSRRSIGIVAGGATWGMPVWWRGTAARLQMKRWRRGVRFVVLAARSGRGGLPHAAAGNLGVDGAYWATAQRANHVALHAGRSRPGPRLRRVDLVFNAHFRQARRTRGPG